MVSINRARPVSTRRLAALVLIALTTVNTLAFSGPVSKFTNDGAYARFYGYSGCLWVYLDVGRGGPKQTPHTWLYYEMYDHCSGWELLASGSGTVPNSAFTTSNKGADFSVTTSNSPGLFTTGATGDISVSFTRDGIYQYTFTGHSSVSYLDRTTIKWHGSSSFGTATASGTLIGATVSQLNGEIGEGRDRQITVEHAAK